jgi:hypothetical protein
MFGSVRPGLSKALLGLSIAFPQGCETLTFPFGFLATSFLTLITTDHPHACCLSRLCTSQNECYQTFGPTQLSAILSREGRKFFSHLNHPGPRPRKAYWQRSLTVMVAVCKVSWDEQEDGKRRTFLEELHLNKQQACLVISMRKHFV